MGTIINYAKYLDIPNWKDLRQQLLDFRNSRSNLDALWWSHDNKEISEFLPDIVKAFSLLGLTARQMIFFTNLNNDLGIEDPLDMRAVFIHTDRPDDPEARFDYAMPVFTGFETTNAINIPLLNCAGSATLFYKLLKNDPDIYYAATNCGGHAKSSVEEVFRFELDRPAVLRINVPHAVYNPHNEPRVVATFRFYESTDHLLD